MCRFFVNILPTRVGQIQYCQVNETVYKAKALKINDLLEKNWKSADKKYKMTAKMT